MRARLTSLGAFSRLRFIALTHHHEDHSGCAPTVLRLARQARRTAAAPPLVEDELLRAVDAGETQVIAHPLTCDLIARGFPIQWYRRLVWGVAQAWPAGLAPKSLATIIQPASLALPAALPSPLLARGSPPSSPMQHPSVSLSVSPDWLGAAAARTRLHDGTWASLVPVASPGHCEDHVVYYVPERRWLFSGDSLVTPRPRMAFHAEDVAAMMASLRHIVDTFTGLVDVVFCAHRGMLPGGMALLAERLRWLEEVAERARALAARGVPADAISREVLGGQPALYYISGGDFGTHHLIHGALAGGRSLPTHDAGAVIGDEAVGRTAHGDVEHGAAPAPGLGRRAAADHGLHRLQESGTHGHRR